MIRINSVNKTTGFMFQNIFLGHYMDGLNWNYNSGESEGWYPLWNLYIKFTISFLNFSLL